MPIRSVDPKPTPKDQRADRLAEALRANLKRRKAADRARREGGKPDTDAPEPGGPGGDD